jgi:hypothetical protein
VVVELVLVEVVDVVQSATATQERPNDGLRPPKHSGHGK